MERRPDIDDEDIGIRTFQLKKEQAAERAIEKIRHHIKEDWKGIISDDIEILKWLLGEAWALMGFYEWSHIAFSKLSYEDIKNMISIGNEIISHNIKGNQGFGKIENILKKTT